MTGKGVRNAKQQQAVLCVWVVYLVLNLNGLSASAATTTQSSYLDLADTTQAPASFNCAKQECPSNRGLLVDLLDELKYHIRICPVTGGSDNGTVELRFNQLSVESKGNTVLEILRQRGLLDLLQVDIYQCEDGLGKVPQCSGLRINETGCTLKDPFKSSRKTFLKLKIYNECVTQFHKKDWRSCDLEGAIRREGPDGRGNWSRPSSFSEEQWLKNELEERYSDTCAFGSTGAGAVKLQQQQRSSGSIEHELPELLDYDTLQFNRPVFGHQGFRYRNGLLSHRSFPTLNLNCKRTRYNASDDVVADVLSGLTEIEPPGSKFVCFASFFWYDLDSESDSIEVTCMHRKDPCDKCLNGAECRRFPRNIKDPARKPFCVCKHPFTGELCDEIKTGLDLNCSSNQMWSRCGANQSNPACQRSCDDQGQGRSICDSECPAAGGCACEKGQYLDGDTCVPKPFCPKPIRKEPKDKDDDLLEDTALGKVIVSLASIAAVMVAALLAWAACICNKKIKDIAHNVKTIPPSLAKSMNKDPSCYDNHYYVSDNEKDYTHEIHDILRAPDDMDAASQKTEEEVLGEEEEDEDRIFCYPPPTPLIGKNHHHIGKDLLYISVQPLKSSTGDSGIDSGSFDDGSRTRCSSGDLSVSSPTFLCSERGGGGGVARMQSSSCDSGISSLRSTSIDESFSDEPMVKVPAVNTVCGGNYWSKDTIKPISPVAGYFNKVDVSQAVCQSGYFGKAEVNAVSGNYWNKLKVGNYWSKG